MVLLISYEPRSGLSETQTADLEALFSNRARSFKRIAPSQWAVATTDGAHQWLKWCRPLIADDALVLVVRFTADAKVFGPRSIIDWIRRHS